MLPLFQREPCLRASPMMIHQEEETMSIEAETIEHYARRAKEYELVYYQKPERQDEIGAFRDLLTQTFSGKRVLEIACGTGFWTQALSHCAQSVTAVDINDEMLRIARAKPLGQANVTFMKLDVYELPDSLGGFDAALIAFWWSHIPKQRLRKFLMDLHRSFSVSCEVLVMDNRYVEGNSTPLSRTDEDGNTYQTRKLLDGSSHELIKNFPTETELLQSLHGIATNIKFEYLQHYWTMRYTAVCSK